MELRSPKCSKSISVRALQHAIEDVSSRRRGPAGGGSLRTGWDFGGTHASDAREALACAGTHEWFGAALAAGGHADWQPPLCVLVHLGHRIVSQRQGLLVLVGRRVWAHPQAIGTGAALSRVVCVDAGDVRQRVWAMELSLRSRAVAGVIGDGSGVRMPDSRRLQIASLDAGVPALLARPPDELTQLSAAMTRWQVRPRRSDVFAGPVWEVELLRCKGLRPMSEEARRFAVRLDHATGSVSVVREAVDRCVPTVAPSRRSA